jgi:ATP-dependent protease HslVU (ClpYQ) peptidase subunit
MTTVVVVRKNGRACIAADTLARYGSTTERAAYIANHDKIVSVDDVFLAPTGPASCQLVLRSYFADAERPRAFGSVLEVFETARSLHAALKQEYTLNPKEEESDPFESLQMELLICAPSGIYGVYPLRSVQEYTRFYAFGSGTDIALGALHACYDDAARPEDLALRALAAAAEFDDATAAPFTLRTVELR